MRYPLRPIPLVLPAMVLAMGIGLVPTRAVAQASGFSQALHRLDPFISHSNPGYLGVLVSDVDGDTASRLKLKEARGALITLIDHDAPAGSTLRINDVVLEINGQRVEGAEQFGRILREVPAGHSLAILVSREGAPVSIKVQLVDRKIMERTVWKQLGNRDDSSGSSSPVKTILPGADAPLPHVHASIFGSTLKVGAMVEPLSAQMAEYIGVPQGIMIKQVARKSEAEAAGLKPWDIVLKVGNDPISTVADWDRALRSNEGKSVVITIVRDRKQQTVVLQVDSKHNKSEVEYPGLLPDGPATDVAESALTELDPFFASDDAAALADAAQGLREQAEAVNEEFGGGLGEQSSEQQLDALRRQAEQLDAQANDFQIDEKQMEQLRQQMEQFRQNFKPEDFHFQDFKFDQKQLDELKKQMDEFRQDFKPEDFQFKGFQIDQKQLDELKREMEQFRQQFKAQDFGIDPKQMEELRRQMDEFRKSFPQQFHLNQRQLEQFRQQLQQLTPCPSQQV